MVKKLTLMEIKEKLKIINPNVKILSTEYINSKEKMDCECLVCSTIWGINWNNLSNNNGCPTCYYNSKLITEEEIIRCVVDGGYEFIDFVNKGKLFNEYRIKIKCPENHIYEVGYQSFQNGKRCKKCGYKIVANKTKNNLDQVLRYIKEHDYSIVGEFNYMNNKSEFTLMCSDGHTRTTCYNYLTNTPICPECSLGRKYKYDINDARKFLSDLEMEFLDDIYIDSHTPFKYRCVCGNISQGKLSDLKQGRKCFECSGDKKYTIEDINLIFNEFNCELLTTDYINNSQKLKFKCKCGNVTSKTLNDFRKSPQCSECGHKQSSGDKHYNWNPNLTEDERLKNRKFKEYEHWRMAVYERDSYTCQCCGDKTGGNLNAHHLDSHDWAKDKRLDLDNGITLCIICHTDFHNFYGYGENTKEQFEEYMKDLYDNAI